ncbi:hypothetical protein B0H14DRAFT_3521044 [Mycena olivaceomarginata]|nr:hypothetical protein B0H14DRAFT_3521044 [Mycena olivaceomarginata]
MSLRRRSLSQKPVAKPVKKPVAKKPVAKPAAKPVAKPKAKPAAKPVAKPAKPVAKKPVAKPVAKPAAKKPVAKPAAKPVAKPKAKPAAKPVAKPAAKPVAKKPKPVAKPATKPGAKPAAKPAAKKPVAKKPVARPVAKKPVAKPAAKPAAKPVAKPAAKPATKAVAKPAAKPSAVTTATKTAAKAVKAKAKRMLGTVTRNIRIANRTFFGLIQPRLTSGNEFVGWHGTNEETAALWESKGEIVRPVTAEGQTKGKSGLDAELGPGLYISDTLGAAAAINAKTNNLAGKVCAIFAKSSASFRGTQDKARTSSLFLITTNALNLQVQIPEAIRGNANSKAQQRTAYLAALAPKNTGGPRSLLLGPLRANENQMLIPESQNPQFEAQCFDVVGLDSAGAAALEAAAPANSVLNRATKYTTGSIISAWRIRKEDVVLAKATVAALEKPAGAKADQNSGQKTIFKLHASNNATLCLDELGDLTVTAHTRARGELSGTTTIPAARLRKEQDTGDVGGDTALSTRVRQLEATLVTTQSRLETAEDLIEQGAAPDPEDGNTETIPHPDKLSAVTMKELKALLKMDKLRWNAMRVFTRHRLHAGDLCPELVWKEAGYIGARGHLSCESTRRRSAEHVRRAQGRRVPSSPRDSIVPHPIGSQVFASPDPRAVPPSLDLADLSHHRPTCPDSGSGSGTGAGSGSQSGSDDDDNEDDMVLAGDENDDGHGRGKRRPNNPE